MRRIDIGVEKMDDERFDAACQQRCHRRLYLGTVELAQNLTVGIDALVDLETQLARDQRFEAADEAVGLRPRPAAELEDVAEATRGDQPDARDLALEQGVRRRRRAVYDGGALREH